MLHAGLSFDRPACSWEDLHSFVVASPPNTAIHHELCEGWSLGSHLLATLLERVNDLLWLKTKDAHKKPPRNRPKRIQRPGVDDRDDMSKALGGRKQQIVPMASFSSLWKQARQAWLDRKRK